MKVSKRGNDGSVRRILRLSNSDERTNFKKILRSNESPMSSLWKRTGCTLRSWTEDEDNIGVQDSAGCIGLEDNPVLRRTERRK